jgi:hypothetical protein
MERQAMPNTFLEDVITWICQGAIMAHAGFWSLRVFGLI